MNYKLFEQQNVSKPFYRNACFYLQVAKIRKVKNVESFTFSTGNITCFDQQLPA